MTRETKLGMAVAGMFVMLVGSVVVYKWVTPDEAAGQTQPQGTLAHAEAPKVEVAQAPSVPTPQPGVGQPPFIQRTVHEQSGAIPLPEPSNPSPTPPGEYGATPSPGLPAAMPSGLPATPSPGLPGAPSPGLPAAPPPNTVMSSGGFGAAPIPPPPGFPPDGQGGASPPTQPFPGPTGVTQPPVQTGVGAGQQPYSEHEKLRHLAEQKRIADGLGAQGPAQVASNAGQANQQMQGPLAAAGGFGAPPNPTPAPAFGAGSQGPAPPSPSPAPPAVSDMSFSVAQGGPPSVPAPNLPQPGSGSPGLAPVTPSPGPAPSPQPAPPFASVSSPGVPPPVVPTPTPTPFDANATQPPIPSAANGASSVPFVIGTPQPAAGQPTVKTYDVLTFRCTQDCSTFSEISKKFYKSDKFTRALLQYNRENGPNMAIRTDPPVLRVGDAVMIPQIEILESRYPAQIRDNTPLPTVQGPPSGDGAAGFAPPAPASGQFAPTSPGGAAPPPTPYTAPPVAAPPVVPPPVSVPPVNAPPVNVPSVNVPSVPAPNAQAFAPSGPTKIYVVRGPNEMLPDIALRTLNSVQRWPEIYRLNPGLNSNSPIPQNTQLQMPPDARVDQ